MSDASDSPDGAARRAGPSDAEIRAAAEVAGDHRVSRPGPEPDRPPAGPGHGRLAQRPAMDFWRALYERRTTRRFDPSRPVPRELVLELLDAALIAPTSCNLQMWDFVVVDDPDQREKLGRLSLQVLTAPVAIFVAYGKEYSEEGHANVQSAAAALMNMSLAAHVLGIGTFWINQLGPRDEVGRILGLPPDREVVAALAVGWPKTYPTVAPKRRPFGHVVHWNHFAGRAIPSSPAPGDWTLELIRDYQHARVLNGNRYNKSRPWEEDAVLRASDLAAPPVPGDAPAAPVVGPAPGQGVGPAGDAAAPAGGEPPRWLEVLPVHGMFLPTLTRRHRDHVFDVLELTEEVARFGLKRCHPRTAGEPVVYDPLAVEDLPQGRYRTITCFNRLEALPPAERQLLLAALHGLLAPGGRLVLQHWSRRSFHRLAESMHGRRGGPGGVEYVLAPDPNLGPWEALPPGEVERLLRAAGFRVVRRSCEDLVPPAAEVAHRTRNMRGAKGALVRGLVGLGRAAAWLPGLTAAFGRTRTLVCERA